MKLYFFIVAPNPTRVRLYLAEKEAAGHSIPHEQVLVNLLEGEQKSPEHLARNPLGKLPVLELDDGSFLTESASIIEFLEEIHPKPPMIGTHAPDRARVRELDRIADFGVLLPIALIVHATNSPLGMPPNPEVAAHSRAALPFALGVLDARLADGRSFLAGDSPCIADGTLAAALQFARFGKVDAISGYPNITRWDRDYRKRGPVKSVLVA